MCVLVNGKVRLEISGKVIREAAVDVSDTRTFRGMARYSLKDVPKDHLKVSNDPGLFGISNVLGLAQTNSGTVVAESVCQARILHRPTFLSVIEEFGQSLQLSGMAKSGMGVGEADTASASLSKVGLFKDAGCEEKFMRFLTEHLEDQIYLSGQTIIPEGKEETRSMFLIVEGTVHLMKSTGPTELGSGKAFGELTVLGLPSKKACAVEAKTLSHVRVLHHRVLMQALELFPEDRHRVLTEALKGENRRAGVNPASVTSCKREVLVNLLSQSPLFSSLTQSFVDNLAAKARDRIYLPGEVVVYEGTEGDSMFVVISGQASVYQYEQEAVPGRRSRHASQLVTNTSEAISGRRNTTLGRQIAETMRHRKNVATLSVGYIFGELAALGVLETRSATVEADHLTSMWEITKNNVLGVLSQYPTARKHFATLINNRLQQGVPERLQNLSLFSGFSSKFHSTLLPLVETRVYFTGQEVIREGRSGGSMYVINVGSCLLKRRGVMVRVYQEGMCFGSTTMLGVHLSYIGSLICTSTCHILRVPDTAFQKALEAAPNPQLARMLLAQEKRSTQEFLESIISTSARKRLWERFEQDLGETKTSTSITAIFEAWQEVADKLRERRLRDEAIKEQRERTSQQWLQRRKANQEKARLRKAADLAPSAALGGFWTRGDEGLPQAGAEVPQEEVSATVPALPPVEEHPAPADPRLDALRSLCESWPAPAPSKHYQLRFWDVLEDSLGTTPSAAAPLLPLLASAASRPVTTGSRPWTSGRTAAEI